MKSRLLSSLLALAATLTGFAADPTPAGPAPVTKMPPLVTDDSPVGQGARPGLVTSYADVVEPVQKAVVSVYSTRIVRERVNPFYQHLFGDQIPSGDAKEKGLGSGVIISADGYILTNNHVVEGADELNVLLIDDREFKAKVIGTDPKTDVAVIKIKAENLPTMVLADSDKVRVGDVVFAVGNPLEVGQTVTMGIISAKNRRTVHVLDDQKGYEDFIQTDAPINPGNSGGALVDAKGRLVGINSAIYTNTDTNIGIGFAIPINLASSIMRSLIETGKVARGFLGVSVNPDPITSDLAEALGLSKDVKGVVITDVTEGAPAAKAGLKQEDVIVSIDDRNITSQEELRLYIAQKVPDSVVKVKFFRDGKENTAEIKLGLLPDDVAASPAEILPGVTVSRLTDDMRRSLNIDDDRMADGLVVTNVDPTSPYSELLQPKMVIIQINRIDISDVESAKAAIRSGRRNLFFVYWRGRMTFIPIDVK